MHYPFPQTFVNRILSQFGAEASAFLESLCGLPVISVRKNPDKPAAVYNGNTEPVLWCKTGSRLPSRPVYTLDPLFHAGCYYPQEASSMILDWILRSLTRVPQHPAVLDLCAAPGGKSTIVASWLQNRGLLVSNEIIRNRSVILAENMIKWGTSNSIVTRNAPPDFSRLNSFFDIIIVDAPCSGEGLFRREKKAIDEWSEASAAGCALRQRDILNAVWPALKSNGTVIYSTCTFNPAENEENVRYFAERHNAEVLPLNVPELWNIASIGIGTGNGLAFYPHRTIGEGFFVAAIRKGEEPEATPIKTFVKAKSLKRSLDFISLLNPQFDWDIYEENESVRAFSAVMLPKLHCIKQTLNILEYGILLGKQSKKGFIPAHGLAMSINFQNSGHFPEIKLELPLALKYLKGEALPAFNSSKGFAVLKYSDAVLGFGKNAGTRINNLYPDRWRIRMNIEDRQV